MCWSACMEQMDRMRGRFDEIRAFIGEVYGHDLHAKRIASLAGATLGVMTATSLAVALIGHALAQSLTGNGSGTIGWWADVGLLTGLAGYDSLALQQDRAIRHALERDRSREVCSDPRTLCN